MNIKFRAWHPVNKHMFKVIGLIFDKSQELKQIRCISKTGREHLFNAKFMELMQFSGMQDKSGRDIYEGDIMLLNASWGTDANTIERCKHTGQLQGRTLFFPGDNTFTFDEFDMGNREVIGNIYENPEKLVANDE